MDIWAVINELRGQRALLADKKERRWLSNHPSAAGDHRGPWACLVAASADDVSRYLGRDAHREVAKTLLWAGTDPDIIYPNGDSGLPRAHHWNDYLSQSREESLSVLDATIDRLVMEMEPPSDVPTVVLVPDLVTVG